ncbi:hypothetical protein [Brevundimonas fontaquae]|uniref:Uncharacterized protein n=1 Tax=Brevundimonas fontaquae TaxID=2813778 RepID=A0ABX7LVZ7_9CAUL|nr:hypothetical protein [Brevundimonas fontaquae]QSF54718.1 hypothetical protein JX001_02535 [Brevundimonas fontaquae]
MAIDSLPTLLLLVDESSSKQWRDSLIEVASGGGFELISGPAPQTFDPQHPTVVISDDVNWTVHIAAARTHVFANGDLPPLAPSPGSFVDRHELHKESRRLVVAAHVISEGATLHDLDSVEAEIDGVGIAKRLGKCARSTVQSPLSIYTDLPPRPGVAAHWPSHVFSYQSEAFVDGSPDIDLTGRPRMLLHGPYVFLPIGRWRADIRFAVDPEGGAAPLRVQWGKDGDYATLEFRVAQGGEYSVSLEHDWKEPAPAQVVIWVTEAVFRGHFMYRGCSIDMIAELKS